MTKDEAIKLALEALNKLRDFPGAFDECLAATKALRVAIAMEPVTVQKPVAWLGRNQIVYFEFEEWMNDCTVPLYTSSCAAQPAKQEQGEPLKKLQVTLEDRPIDIELAQYKRMFEAACSALGAVSDALGCDPEEGGAEPILAAIAELKASKQEQGEPVAYIHRNEYNEYRLEPTDNFKITDLPVGVDVMLYPSPQPKQEQGEPVALETIYETIIDWDEGGGKRSRRELARRIEELYTKPSEAQPEKQERPQNCGTGYCSCIECVMEQEPVAEPHKGEPVAWADSRDIAESPHDFMVKHSKEMREGLRFDTPLYTTPQQRKPLTNEQIAEITVGFYGSAIHHDDYEFARAIEAAHGIKE
jgi:hypothetical protein